MINTYHGTGIIVPYSDFTEFTYMRMPKTEEKQLERTSKLIRTMQKQGQFQEIEILYRLLKLMTAPDDNGELGSLLANIAKLYYSKDSRLIDTFNSFTSSYCRGYPFPK